ncbi:MAG: hypothetical protein GXO36_01360 [Chloroflexi bacterium]|nr:hypothetical protein [Chloroflexota bacterium]
MWRIFVSDRIHEDGLARLRAAEDVAEVRMEPGLDPAALAQALAQGYHALIVRSRTKVTRDLLAAAPSLRVVGRAGVGVDNIDLDAAKARGVIVVNAPEATTDAVAEHTLALLFAVARHIPRADASMKAGRWEKKAFQGIELAGKTLGIIGVGRIGAAVARRARGLGMRVLGYDPYLDQATLAARGVEPVADLATLLARSDVVSVHVPLTPETRGLLDAQALAQLKPGAIVLSTARGGVVDEAALLAALDEGRVLGAGLDVFEHEPPGATRLVTHPRVVATPHIAAQTREAQARVARDIADEVLAALRGARLRWRVV